MPAALEVHDLVKSYGGRRAVDGVSLVARQASVLALLGPNGAGKTSTVEICEGLRSADSGSVRVLGADPHRDARALRPRVGVMLQDGVGGYTAATVHELLTLFARYARHPHAPEDMIAAVGLDDAAGTAVKRLSGGQQQRLSLALALVGRPELVFLDEPTAGMDPQARRSTWELITGLREDGVTVLLTTHFLDEAERLADDVVVLDAGRVVASGTPAELTRAGAEGQLRFRSEPALPTAGLEALLGPGTRVEERSPGDYLVSAAVTPVLPATVTAWCAAQNALVAELTVQRRTLEDVFLELTGHEVRS